MMCKHPFIKKPAGTVRQDPAGRLEATPLPCGRCLHCRINKSREWTHRLLLENSCHGDSLFSTFTFSEENLPPDGSVDPQYLKNFLKRVNRRLDGKPYRYFAVGEYGDKSWRPHYHIMFFGLGAYDTEKIDSAWNYGKGEIGFTLHDEVNQLTCGYIAGYTIKKLTRDKDPYLEGRKPEFMRSSRKEGGIGLPGIKRIAEQLNKNKHWKPTILTELKHGKKTYPLGRYLTVKLAELQGIEEKDFDEKLYNYQQEVFDECMKGGFYYDHIVEQKKQDRRKQEWRHKNFKKRSKI